MLARVKKIATDSNNNITSLILQLHQVLSLALPKQNHSHNQNHHKLRHTESDFDFKSRDVSARSAKLHNLIPFKIMGVIKQNSVFPLNAVF